MFLKAPVLEEEVVKGILGVQVDEGPWRLVDGWMENIAQAAGFEWNEQGQPRFARGGGCPSTL
jgi:hypothetical protein